MATRKLEVQIIGDSRSLERAFARSQRSATQFQTGINGTVAKVEGSFTRMQRIAAGGFIGGAIAATALSFLKSTSQAAAESQQVLGQTQVALESTGQSWARYGARIQEVVAAQSRLGFDDEALLQTFAMFVRRTGDVEQALRDNSLAMDVARARFISLEQAANLVNKAALGQAGSLRRLGIDTKGVTDGTQLLALLTEKYGGSAQKASKDATTAFERVTVSSENLQESLGTLIQPYLTNLATGLADAAEAAALLVQGLHDVGNVKLPVAGTLGSLFSKGLNVTKFTPLNPFFAYTIVKNIADQFDSQTKAQTSELKFRFGKSLQDLVDAASQQPPLTPAADFAKLPGIDTGTPLAQAFGAGVDKFISVAKAKVAAIVAASKAANAKAQNELDKQNASDLAIAKERARQRLAEAQRVARELRQQNQFRAIGLTATGLELAPTAANLRKQFESLSKRAGGEDVPRNLRDRLAKVGRFLKGDLKGITEDTRRAIKDLFDTIRSSFDQGSKSLDGPLTKTTTLNTQRALANVTGLNRDQIRQIRANLSNFNSAGIGLAGATTAAAAIAVTTHTTVNLDGQKVAQNTTKHQQKAARRNPRQKRGPNRSGI